MLHCEICDKEIAQPIVITTYRSDGIPEIYMVCSGNCKHQLWEQERGNFSSYILSSYIAETDQEGDHARTERTEL